MLTFRKGGTIDTECSKERTLLMFFSENVKILAQQKLSELKCTNIIREYVIHFAVLMLDIHDMSEKDKVFYFVEGLKSWPKTKLYE